MITKNHSDFIKFKEKHKEKKFPEQELQKKVILYLNYYHKNCLFWHTPNEGNRGGFKGKIDGQRRELEGVKRGVSDIICLEPNGQFLGFAMELKIHPNKASESQKYFLKSMQNLGYDAIIIYDLESAIEYFKKYFS